MDDNFPKPDNYGRELLSADQKRKAQQRLDSLLLEGLESGPATPLTRED